MKRGRPLARGELAAARAARWQAALERWSGAIALRPPQPSPADGPIACIDLTTRQTLVDFRRLAALGLEDCEEALFAHEAGHHIRYPHTLVRARQHARFLRSELSALAEAWELPNLAGAARAGRHDGLLNLLYDLLINTDLRPHYEAQFIRLYTTLSQGGADPIFGYYLALYEALWYLPDGTLVSPAMAAALDRLAADWRTSAAACAQFIVNRPDNHCLQLVRFLIALRPFLAAGAQMAAEASPEGTDGFGGELAPEDAARVLRPAPGEEEARAWQRGATPGTRAGRSEATGAGGKAGQPGQSGGDPVRDAQAVLGGLCDATAVALATYRRLAAQAPVEPPRGMRPGTPEVPGPPVEWQIGDRIESIDWFATLTRSGVAIPGYTVQRRTWLPADPTPGDQVVPWVELYVDSSGSMPDPVRQLNHSILAGFILTDAAVAAGGRVRVIVYSHHFEAMPDFVQSPRPAWGALLSYVGGGTVFPWRELHRSAQRWRRAARVVRVIISDADFSYNFRAPEDLAARDEGLATAVQHGQVVALLDGGDPATLDAVRARGVEVVPVSGWSSLPILARGLAAALFPEGEPAPG